MPTCVGSFISSEEWPTFFKTFMAQILPASAPVLFLTRNTLKSGNNISIIVSHTHQPHPPCHSLLYLEPSSGRSNEDQSSLMSCSQTLKWWGMFPCSPCAHVRTRTCAYMCMCACVQECVVRGQEGSGTIEWGMICQQKPLVRKLCGL